MTVGQQLISWSLSVTPQKAEVLKSTLWVEKKQPTPVLKPVPLTGPRDAVWTLPGSSHPGQQ